MGANIVIAFIGAIGVGILVSGLIYPLRRRFEGRKQHVAGLEAVDGLSNTEELATVPPLVDRLFGPMLNDLIGFIGGDQNERAELTKRLQRSGWRYPSVGDFYAQKIMTAALFFLGGAGALVIIGNPALFFVPLILGAVGLYIPNREVNQALKKRREALYVEMAFTLDRLAVLMQAGLAFQQALVELSRAPGKGIFLSGLRQAVTEISLGSSVPEALEVMQDALPQEAELDKFVERARKGGPMSDALVSQAELMRRRVENRLLAKGLRSTLMITTVGGAFILPALALEVVGPPLVLAMRIFQF
jgi:Flp pilus assembly protein TadB